MNDQPSVLIVSQWGRRGGAPNIARSLAAGLRRRGVDVSMLLFEDGPLVGDLVEAGVPQRVLPVRSKYDMRALPRLRRILRSLRPDLIHTHGQTAMFYGNLAARLSGVPAVITTFHGLSGIRGQAARYRFYAWTEGWYARHLTDRCVVWCEEVRADSIARRRVPPEKTAVIHNGIDLGRFTPVVEPEKRVAVRAALGLQRTDLAIGAVGELLPVKGHTHLIAALSHVKSQLQSVKLLIIGDGPLRESLARQADAAGLADSVVLLGERTVDRLFYSALDLFVYPSLQGVFGIVVIEAMACGVPVIASRLPGVEELVSHEQTGLLAEPAQSDSIAGAILRLARDPSLATRLVNSARPHVEAGYSEEAMVDQHLSLYLSVLGAKAG